MTLEIGFSDSLSSAVITSQEASSGLFPIFALTITVVGCEYIGPRRTNRMKGFKKKSNSGKSVSPSLTIVPVCLMVATFALAPFLISTLAGQLALVLLAVTLATTAWLRMTVLKLVKNNEDLAEASSVESHAAMHDPLTGAANRRQFEQRLADLRSEDDPNHVLLMLDLDRFKPINDLHGHAAGDALLIEIANGLAKIVTPRDTVARLGGDEFAILLHSTNEQLAKTITLKALDFVLKFRLSWQGQRLSVGTSIGMVSINAPGHTAADLMAMADEALYAAKEAGRGVAFIARPATQKGGENVFELVGDEASQESVTSARSHEPEDGRKQEVFASVIKKLATSKSKEETRQGSRRRHDVKHWVMTEPRTIGDDKMPGMRAREIIDNAAKSNDGGADLARWTLIQALNAASRLGGKESDHIGFVLPIPAQAIVTVPTLGAQLMRINALHTSPIRNYTYLLHGVGACYTAPEIVEFQELLANSQVGLAFEIRESTLDVLAPLQRVNFDEVFLSRELTHNLKPGNPRIAAVETLLDIAKQRGIAPVAAHTESEEEFRKLAEMGIESFSGPFITKTDKLDTVLDGLSTPKGDSTEQARKSA